MSGHVQPRVLREYAFIADGERGALIGPDGTIAWMCMPTWDSPAVFAELLGGAGRYSVAPADSWHVWGGYYEGGSLIWRSRWVGDSVTECREAFAMPADRHRCVILRRVEAIDGPARVSVVLDLRAGYGRDAMSSLELAAGSWTGRAGQIRFRWSGASAARPDQQGALTMTLDLAAGEHHDLVLELSDRPLDHGAPEPDGAWQATQEAWSSAVPLCDDLTAARDARHAYAVLRGLTAGSGAMAAAATTSLPERLEGSRNYDYRFAWIRDQCYAGIAVAAHGPHPLLGGTLSFLTERVLDHGPKLAPAYTVTGKPVPAERRLRLRGYPGGTAVAGNGVRDQFQLDCLGEIVQVMAAGARHDMLSAENWHAVEVAVTAIGERWSEAEAGLWELDNRHWTHSRLACVAGLRAIAAAAPGASGGHGFRQAADWGALADKIVDSLGTCVHGTGRWQRSPDDERVDASLLLPMIRGAVAADDPRNRATFRAIADELTDDGYLYRFRHDNRPLRKAEGAFLLCGFWMAQASHLRGKRIQAARWFERNRAACGPAGLYTEEYDVHQRQLRGNLPQAFVHAAMLECAVTLSADGADAGASGP